MPARARLALPLAILAAHGCGARDVATVLPQGAAPPPPAAGVPAPPRYLVAEPTWIERSDDGLDRVVAGGQRLELRRFALVRAAPPSPEVDGGARSPAWMPARYIFWKGLKLYAAATFTGELTQVATLPAEPLGSFDWLNGTGLRMPGGAMVVPASGPPQPLGVPLVVNAIAADARRAVVLTAVGRAVITSDGGATFREASELRGAVSLAVRGEEIAATLRDGRERFVTVAGAVADPLVPHLPGPTRGRRPADDPEPFPGGSAARALAIAAERGIPTGDGGVVSASGGLVGRLDLTTLRMTSLAEAQGLDGPGTECVAFRAADGPLLACADESRAAIVDLSGAPRVERTFDLEGAPERVRFTGADGDAIGYVGPCDGPPEPANEIVVNGDPYGFSREHTAAFCVRAGRDAWVEHRLDPVDFTDLFAWIPRAGGGAVALVARPGAFPSARERVTVRGGLRVVRVGRSEPPLSLTPYAWDGSATLDRSFRVGADDTIEGWIPNPGSPGVIAARIDAAGLPSAWPTPPRASRLAAAGPLALVHGDDGKLWETTDGGRRWIEVEPPPGRWAAPSACSPAGCALGPFARLGWTTPDRAAPVAPRPTIEPERPRARRSQPTPVARLACAFDGPPESKRGGDGEGFGTGKSIAQRSPLARLGTLGAIAIPYTGPNMPITGDMEIAWVAPLDPAGAIRRAMLPVSLLGGSPHRLHEVRLGWLLAEDGSLDTMAVGRGDRCAERALSAAGMARAVGGCVDEPTVAVEIGGRTFAVHAAYQGLGVLAGTAAPRDRGGPRGAPKGAAAPGAAPAGALRQIAVTGAGGALRGFTFGIGARAGAPVVVGVDLRGGASLSPVDPVSGVMGAEERLRPLAEATLGSAPACAPRPDDARVVIPFEGLIGLERGSLRGVVPAPGAGVAIVRWSRERACLDAIEIPVRDERFDETLGSYDRPGSLHKLVARLGGSRGAVLLTITSGVEVRQKLRCGAVLPGSDDGP